MLPPNVNPYILRRRVVVPSLRDRADCVAHVGNSIFGAWRVALIFPRRFQFFRLSFKFDLKLGRIALGFLVCLICDLLGVAPQPANGSTSFAVTPEAPLRALFLFVFETPFVPRSGIAACSAFPARCCNRCARLRRR
jgi:hypothetical protein